MAKTKKNGGSAAGGGRTLEQREAYHQAALKRIAVKKQIEALKKSLK